MFAGPFVYPLNPSRYELKAFKTGPSDRKSGYRCVGGWLYGKAKYSVRHSYARAKTSPTSRKVIALSWNVTLGEAAASRLNQDALRGGSDAAAPLCTTGTIMSALNPVCDATEPRNGFWAVQRYIIFNHVAVVCTARMHVVSKSISALESARIHPSS